MSAPRPSVLATAVSALVGAFGGLMLFSFVSPDVSSPTGIIGMGGLGAIVGVILVRNLLTDAKPRERSAEEIERALRRDLRAGFGFVGVVVGVVASVILGLDFPFALALTAGGGIAGVEIPVAVRQLILRRRSTAAPPEGPET